MYDPAYRFLKSFLDSFQISFLFCHSSPGNRVSREAGVLVFSI